MSIFGNIQNGVFSGFGKPYIKLEFDDNMALLDFQKRMNESGEAQEAEFEDGEFRPIEGTAADEETRKYNFYLLLMSDIEPLKSEKFTSQTLNNYEREGQNFKIITPIGEVIIKRKLIYGVDKHLLKHIYPYFNVLKRTLEDPTCIFKSSDNKGHLNNTFAKCFYLDGIRLLTIVSPINPNTLELKTTYPADKSKRYINNYNEVWDLVKRGGEKIIYSKKSTNDLCGLEKPQIIKSSFDKIIEFRLPCKFENNFSDNQIFDRKKLGALNGYGDKYTVIDNRKRAKKEPGELVANKNLSFRKKGKAAENYNKDAYDESKYKNVVVVTNFDGTFIEFQIFKAFSLVTKNTKLEAPFSIKEGADGKKYKGTLHREIVKANNKDLYNIQDYIPSKKQAYVSNEIYKKYYDDALKQFFDYLKREIKYYQDELEKSNKYKYSTSFAQQIERNLKEAQKEYNYNVAFYGYDDLGKTANPYLYNNNEIIDCRGLKPTYKILDNYDNFFDVADTKTSFAGFGLTDTKKLISETCRAHWRDCKKIAAHLKDDSLLQSCFNLWHWLRFNIRYEYDKEGREEIRTPLRVWHDRARGVDCDCLSVFSWCVLRCMGYDPVFELVAFKNRPQFSQL